jgi:hypothetical protein
MTVGELVKEEANSYYGLAISPEDEPIRFSSKVVPAFQSLGIWDAEVLEGEYDGDSIMARSLDEPLSFDGVSIFSDLDAYFQHHIMQGRHKGKFRLIVLPCKEEKK